ncbi:5'/3'-nucleotidase SurE [Psychrobacter sp. 16-MNA-CIBAN-0192]|uniref:5'/3'-nucleotidase SurE n=1 Tax=Psychrobacter sp. 16-MNA-CIBAN-0192 TaxID=3140448 RepID=UPI00332E4890
MNILISNDDGVHAPGLLALYKALSVLGEVKVVAPVSEQSGCASALNISQPLYTHQLSSGFIAVTGSPADCVYLALHHLYRDVKFDCVITGINSGANLGQDVLFSGTFGAALTAQLFGLPAIATSLVGGAIKGDGQDQMDGYQLAAAEIVKILIETPLLAELKRLPYHVLNVNIPEVNCATAVKGRKITRLGHSDIACPVHPVVDPRGRDAYWLSLRKIPLGTPVVKPNNADMISEPDANRLADIEVSNQMLGVTDVQAVAAGYISISPVRVHHTPTDVLNRLSTLMSSYD